VPIFNGIDVGLVTRLQGPSAGQEAGSLLVEGSGVTSWARGSKASTRSVAIDVQAPFAIGGNAAYSKAATALVVQQLVELANNRSAQPCYVQWSSGAGQITVGPFDGWYRLDAVIPLEWYWNNHVPCQVTATLIAAGAPRQVALSYSGGALATNFSGAAVNLVSLPVGSTAMETSFTRTGGEGAVPCVSAPVASPEPFVPSTTLTNLWKGGAHVYDTINTSTNPVPTAGGTFIHANWVEVFGTDHDFVGDCVITNGLQLLLFQINQGQIAVCYVWNTALATPTWQTYGNLVYLDNVFATGTLRAYTLVRVGPEECALTLTSSVATVAQHTIRLQRGRYDVRVDFRPLGAAISAARTLLLTGISGSPKILFNGNSVSDAVLIETAPLVATDYGFGAAFPIVTSSIIYGFLYQNQPSANQPGNPNTVQVALGDATSLAVNAQRSYGFFAVPYGSSGSFSTSNLQAEAESGTLGTGWTSQANAQASAGNEAKCASGTLTGNSDTFGTSFLPAPGTYDIWFRVKVTAIASTTGQMFFGLWDVTGATPVPLSGSTLAPSQLTTGYGWVRANQRTVADGVLNTTTTVTSATAVFVSASDAGKAISGVGIPAGTTIASVTNATTIVLSAAATASTSGVTLTIGGAITPTSTHNMQFRVQTIGTLATDFFVDEAVLLPRTLTALGTGPQDIWQQFAFDRGTRWIRP
jgi:hypothetical protein